jgi:hypothetical protein
MEEIAKKYPGKNSGVILKNCNRRKKLTDTGFFGFFWIWTVDLSVGIGFWVFRFVPINIGMEFGFWSFQ